MTSSTILPLMANIVRTDAPSRAQGPAFDQHPPARFRALVGEARESTLGAIRSLHQITDEPRPGNGPVDGLPIDPRVGVVVQARASIATLDRALVLDVPRAGLDAARNAQRELLQGAATIENGHPSLVPATGHFNAAVNWLNTALNLVPPCR